MKPDTKNTSNDEITSRGQNDIFEKAVGQFRAGKFSAAREMFERAKLGPAAELRHAAEMHIRMCDRRMSSEEPEPATPDEKYTYGISLMNRGELERAEHYLRAAVDGNGKADHFLYALALCLGLRGDFDSSAESLRRAIEIQPANRVAARNDADFMPLLHHPRLREVLNG